MQIGARAADPHRRGSSSVSKGQPPPTSGSVRCSGPITVEYAYTYALARFTRSLGGVELATPCPEGRPLSRPSLPQALTVAAGCYIFDPAFRASYDFTPHGAFDLQLSGYLLQNRLADVLLLTSMAANLRCSQNQTALAGD